MGNILKRMKRSNKHTITKEEKETLTEQQYSIYNTATYNRVKEPTPSEYSTYLADLEVQAITGRESPIISFEPQYFKPTRDAS
jgi:hypothetical protein